MILRLIVAAIIFYVVYRLTRMLFLPGKRTVKPITKEQRENIAGGEDLVEDPYCHTYLPISNAFVWEERGETRHFCSRRCMEAYQREAAARHVNEEGK